MTNEVVGTPKKISEMKSCFEIRSFECTYEEISSLLSEINANAIEGMDNLSC